MPAAAGTITIMAMMTTIGTEAGRRASPARTPSAEHPCLDDTEAVTQPTPQRPMTSPPLPAAVHARASLLRLLAWLSPAFPTGGFAYSHGLEWAVEAGDVCDQASLAAWVSDVLAYGSGRNDAILLRQAHRAADAAGLAQVAALARATASGRERLAEAVNQGNAFLLAAAAWSKPPDGAASGHAGTTGSARLEPPALPPDLPYAVAVGAVARLHGVAEDDVAVGFLQAFAANLISAAVRLVPLGQTAGLQVLAGLEPLIVQVAEATRGAGLDDLGGACFRSDLAAMRHETQYTRLFRS